MIWGGSFVTQSLSASRMGTFSFGMLRMIPASLFLLGMVGISRRLYPREKYSREQKKELLTAVISCGVMLSIGINLQQYGMRETSAGKGGFITALYIVLVPVFGLLIGEKTEQARVALRSARGGRALFSLLYRRRRAFVRGR